MTDNTAIEFLFFSYFGIDLADENNQDTLLDAAIDRAYVDASRRVWKFEKNSELTDVKKTDLRANCRKKANGKIKESILKQQSIGEVYNELEGVYDNSDLKITFGIAQKWYNMTIKYIFIMNVLLSKRGNFVLNEICKNYKGKIDVPVDDFIIKAACGKGVDVPCNGGKSSYSNKIAWSKWEESHYTTFQDNIKNAAKNEDILDYENRLWIDEAKKRKNINKEGAQ